MRLAHAGRILLKMFADDVARQIQLQKVA